MIYKLLLSVAVAASSSASFTVYGVVPAIIRINHLPNNKVNIQANVPVTLSSSITNCDGPTDVLPLNVICDFTNEPSLITVE